MPQEFDPHSDDGSQELLTDAVRRSAVIFRAPPRLLSPELEVVVYGFNKTTEAVPQLRLIHEEFETQVELTPDVVAVVFDRQSLTYKELNSKANQLAHYLRNKGIGPDQLVGICVERGLEMVVGLLGVLKAGGAYLPLDPSYPTERLRYMLANAQPRAVLTQTSLRDMLLPLTPDVTALDGEWDDIAQCETANIDFRQLTLTSRNLAYVIYTSGSTGRPKGVMVEHGGVVNLLKAMQTYPGISATDRMLAVTTISFDIAGLEIYLPLVNGATLIMASQEAVADAQQLMTMLEEYDITVLQTTPARWQLLLSIGWAGRENLKALCGGEALFADLSAKLAARVSDLWNLYGPTETTIWSCCRQIVAIPGECGTLESIGRPIANTKVYILDPELNPMPVGASGEIYLAGVGVARGYLNRPDLTAERFLVDPFDSSLQARMYKTGDLGRWRPDGNLEYLGRNDDQVKIRGFRIETAEITTHLQQHSQVKEAMAVVREDGLADKRVVAYVVPSLAGLMPWSTGDNYSLERGVRHRLIVELREWLRARLPEYMMPSAWVMLKELPLTPNGKLDRHALPAPEDRLDLVGEYVAPRTELERTLADVWAQVISVNRIGVHDNFFELGGHSVLGTRVVARIVESLTVQLPVAMLFKYPTIYEMAKYVESVLFDNLKPETSDKINCEEGTI